MKARFTIILLLFSILVFSQTITREEITRMKVPRKVRKRMEAERALRDSTIILQEGNVLTTWTSVHVPGVKTVQWRKIRVAAYENGEPHGIYLELNERGDTTTVGSYCHGRYSGTWKSYSAGKVSSIRTYDSLGNKIGLQLVADANGQVITKQIYISVDNYYTWAYCSNGCLSFRGQMVANKKEGVWYEYKCVEEITQPEDTLPVLISEWKNGMLDGFKKEYVLGVLRTEWHYKKNMSNGVYRKYENGILRLEAAHIDNLQNGQAYIYSVTGKLQEMQGYVNGTPDGEWVIYDTITHVKLESKIYSLGILLSFQQRMSNGQLIHDEKLIAEDSMYYRITEYYENGKVKNKERIVDGDRAGKYETWYENGRKKCSVYYSSGIAEGPVSAWSERGIQVYRCTAHNGEAGPDEAVWDDNGNRLAYATAECDSQATKYAPEGLRLFTVLGYKYSNVLIEYRYDRRTGTAETPIYIMEEVAVPIPSNMPLFPGGEEERVKWLKSNLRYPDMDREAGIQGSNYVRFTVNADSTISDVEIVRSASAGLDKELVRVTKQMPKWKPAMHNGKPIRTRCVMGVSWVID